MGWKSRKGATSLEYGILAALIAVVMMVTLPLVIEEPMCRLIDVGCVIETRMTLVQSRIPTTLAWPDVPISNC